MNTACVGMLSCGFHMGIIHITHSCMLKVEEGRARLLLQLSAGMRTRIGDETGDCPICLQDNTLLTVWAYTPVMCDIENI